MTPSSSSVVAVFDCFSGIAGDMTLAALVDAGASLDAVRSGLQRLGLPRFELGVTPVVRGGLSALLLSVSIEEERIYQPDEMLAMVTAAALAPRVAGRSLAAIDALVAGEAEAHAAETPHLHEAGGVDAMVDIVGSMLALENLGIEEAFCPVVTVGAGAIVSASHGPIPASPGPAAARILTAAGFPLRFVDAPHELITPTGAAILAAVARPFPATIVVESQGAGAGTFDSPGRPNALRVFVGHIRAAESPSSLIPHPSSLSLRPVVELAANIDDMPPSLLAHVRDRLLEEGALDAWLEPLGMKKGRAATKLCVLVDAADESRMAAMVVRESTTLGVRATSFRRYEMARHVESFTSSLGPVRIKVGEMGSLRRASPEFEDVKAIAARLDIPALDVQRQIESELRAAGLR